MYRIAQRILDQITTAFTYHAPQTAAQLEAKIAEAKAAGRRDYDAVQTPLGQQERYVDLRDQARSLAERICLFTPPSREQSIALTKLEECVMWANASIARNE